MKVNLFEGLSNGSNYQFPRWSTTISRPHSSSPSKDIVKETFSLGVDNRNPLPRPESAISTKRIIKHHVCIPTGTRLISPPPLTQPSTSPELNRKLDHSLPKARNARLYRSIPVRIKSTALTIPTSKTKNEFSLQNFPKQTHEQRKITHARKHRIQQAQILAEKYAETETWFQLKRSLSELKRLATVQDILIDPQTSVLNSDEEKKPAVLKSESSLSTPFSSTVPSRESNRTSLNTSQNSFYRSRIAKQAIETYSQLVFKPLIVASKPIHPFLLPDNHHPSPISRLKPPPSSPLYRFRPITTPLSDEKRAQLLISDLSTNDDDDLLTPTTPSPSLVKIDHETLPRKISSPSPTRFRAPSSHQLTSTIKLKAQTPRCRSATDIKSPSLTTKDYPRFILIVDQEHRIESWYYQYPFIHADDLLTAFQSKSSQQQISAFFIDDLQSSKSNLTATTFLRGKPFHINNDWKKYDFIFISKNIYEDIIIYLQTIINLIKLSGKTIEIYQINHEEDLKKQVKKYF